MKRIVLWGAIIFAGLIVGASFGLIIDSVLWRVSGDYVYSPGFYASRGWRFGALLGTILAGFATAGRQPVASAKYCVLVIAVVLFLTTLGGVLGAFCGGAVGKSQPHERSQVTLAPRTRILFCEGLWKGSALGSCAATAAAGAGLLRIRAKKA